MATATALTLLWIVCLPSLVRMQGSSAVTRRFVLKGEDVSLEIQKPDLLKGNVDLAWTYKKDLIIIKLFHGRKPDIYNNYTGRVELPIRNYSLGLKNLQEADSGVYTAYIILEKNQLVAEYNVTVQERVSPPVLTVNSVSPSSDSCNLTVTCRAQDSSISSNVTCYKHTLSQEGGERSEVTTSAASLYVYLSNDSIICKHSNQVSFSEDMKKIGPLCQVTYPGPDSNYLSVVPIVVFVLVVIGCPIVFILHRRRSGTYEREHSENTVYDTAQNPYRDQLVNQNETDSGISSIYSTVQPHTAAPMVATETRASNQPESLYATVNKNVRP